MWTGLNKLIAQNQVYERDNIQNIKQTIHIYIPGGFIITSKNQVNEGYNIQYI